jgi:hypothetical protein
MVSTQDVGFGTLWAKLVGDGARWEPGADDIPALAVEPGDPPRIGMGLVSVWVAAEGPVLVCHPGKGLHAIKDLRSPQPAEEVRRILRETKGVVLHEHSSPRRDSMG